MGEILIIKFFSKKDILSKYRVLASIRQKQPIILASQSPRRKEFLQGLGLTITVVPSEIAEVGYGGNPDKVASRIVIQKLKAVKAKLDLERRGCLIAADTVVALDSEIFGKPENVEIARTMLMRLSGKTHQVYTCFRAETEEGDFVEKTIKTSVQMRQLTPQLLDWYVQTNEPMDKAGSYGIQGLGSILVESISGSYSNVVGLPMAELTTALEDLGVIEFS